MRWLRTVLAAGVVTATALVTPTGAGATALAAVPPTSWTESAYTSVFKDSAPSPDASDQLRLDTARNDYEAAQVVLRSPAAFTINGLTFTDLTGTGTGTTSGTIAAANVTSNYVGYKRLNVNSHFGAQGVDHTIRDAPGDFPDQLLNDPTISVPANTSQSIWVRVYVPAETAGGIYRGTVTVRTSAGDLPVAISVNAREVTIPPAADSEFTNTMWQSTLPSPNPDPTYPDTIKLFYGHDRYSAQWWQLVDNMAALWKRYRTNNLQLPLIALLRDAGSYLNPTTGKYTFNWTLIDQVVEHFQANGAVHRLEGFDPIGGDPKYRVAAMPTTPGGFQVFYDWDSAAGQNWMNQYIPALRDHVAAKGWSSMWWHHIADEPSGTTSENQWIAVEGKLRSLWPGIRIGDAVVNASAATIAQHEDIVIPNLHTYTANPVPFDKEHAEKGKELWFYNCNIPVGGHLNRFIDEAQWNQRLTMWLAYGRGATGYLHWAFNNWQADLDGESLKGDHYIVWPDAARNTFQATTRYESLRDGMEDWEVLNILGKTKPGLAKELVRSLVERNDKYTLDTAYMQKIRVLALDAAAGKPLVAGDLAAGRTATASSQLAGSEPAKAFDGDGTTGWQPVGNTKEEWLQVDLGGQAQVTGAHLTWSGAAPANYRVQLSYTGTHWTDAATTSVTDPEYFAGINGKARYLRVVVPAGAPAVKLTSVEVAGSRLFQQNLAGGKSYTKSVAPTAGYTDAGEEATDGALAYDWGDGRDFGYEIPADGKAHSYDVTVDLGVVQTVARARMHAYENYPDYQPDSMSVSTSGDGVNFTNRGSVAVVNGMHKVWYELDFGTTRARFVRFTYTKTRTATGTHTFFDDLEVYGTSSQATDELPGSAGYEWGGQELVFAPTTTGTMRRWNWASGQGTVNQDWGGGPIVGRPTGYAWNDQQHAVARNADGDLLHWWYINGETQPHLANWGGDAASDPSATTWGGQQHIFAASTDGALSHWWWDPADGKLRLDKWSGAPGAIVGRPAVYTWNDQLHVVARGADNHLYHWWWIADEAEPHFADWGGEAYSDPSAFTWNGQQHIFTQAADGQLYHWFWDAGDGLHKVKWTGAPGKFVGAPAAFKQGAQQHVVARGPGNTLYHWWWDQATGLVKFEDKGGQAYSDPIAYVFEDQTQLFAQSSINTLYHWWWTPQDGWHQNDWGGNVKYS